MNNIEFKPVESVDNLQIFIKDVFDIKLDISGGWGYDNNSAVVVEKLDIPVNQFINMFATMRANIEMNLTLEKDERYSGINLTLENSKNIEINHIKYNIVNFKITAINEKEYIDFMKEYKNGYGKVGFNLEQHFQKRKEKTIERYEEYWFKF